MIITKEYLRNHAEHRDEYEDELRRYELLSGEPTYKSPSASDGMPHAAGSSTSQLEEAVIRKYDSESALGAILKVIQEEEQIIEVALQQLTKAKQKTVIRIKYFHRYDWDDTALFMFGDAPDYGVNEDKYKARAQRIHGEALSQLAKIQI